MVFVFSRIAGLPAVAVAGPDDTLLAAVGELAAAITHEINNPMAFVRADLAIKVYGDDFDRCDGKQAPAPAPGTGVVGCKR